jgi:hypothetical protein
MFDLQCEPARERGAAQAKFLLDAQLGLNGLWLGPAAEARTLAPICLKQSIERWTDGLSLLWR